MTVRVFAFLLVALCSGLSYAEGGGNKVRWRLLKKTPEGSSPFLIKGGKIFSGGSESADLIAKADLNSFEIGLTQEGKKGPSIFWARDKENVYFGSSILSQADRKTFEIMNDQIGKDKSHVYCWDFHSGGFGQEVEVYADPKTFRVIRPQGSNADSMFFYFRDDHHIFSKDCLFMKNADADTFGFVKAPSLKVDAEDKNRKYLFGKTIE